MATLVTGATGFIGVRLVRALLAAGAPVRVLIRRSGGPRSEEVRALLADPDLDVVEGDLTDRRALARATEGVDVVHHLAWQSNRPTRVGADRSSHSTLVEANLDGTRELLAASAEADVHRFIFVSTVAVYGQSADARRWPLSEHDRGRDVRGFFQRDYVEPKRRAEQMVKEEAGRAGMEYVILRPSIVYGAGAQFAELWLRRVLRTRGGSARRRAVRDAAQWVHVRDVVAALLLAMKREAAADDIFNVAGDEVAPLAAMEAVIRGAARRVNEGLPPLVSGGRFRPGRRPLRYDLAHAATTLGFRPQVSLNDGLAEMTEDVLAHWRAATPVTSDVTVGGAQPIRPPKAAGPGASHGREAGDDLGKLLNEYYGKLLSVDALRDYYGDSDFWNYGLWERDTKTQADACLNLLDELLSFLAHTRGSILDVACGKGATTRELLDYYPPHQVTGINISPEQLEVCARNAPGVSFLRMDATDLQFPDETFDNVLCVEAACHFDTRRDFLCEAHRVLKPGGRLAICDAVLPFSSRGQPHANYVTSVAAYRDQCHDAGFETVELFDRTRECWGGFSQHLLQYVRGQWRHGEVPMRAYRVTQQWLERVSTELYVVGYCGKA